MASPREYVRRGVVGLPLPLSRRMLFLANYGYIPNLRNPRTFHEKLNWRIAYGRDPLLVVASSKVQSKQYAQEVAPGVGIPRTLWHGDDLHELQKNLQDKWVLKASHRSGCTLFGDGPSIDATALAAATDGWLNEHEWKRHRLWAYKHVRRELILEERLPSLEDAPVDYKFFVFSGVVGMVQVDTGRFGSPRRHLYDADWTSLPFAYTHPRSEPCEPPPRYQGMCAAASRLGARFDFVRVDLYNIYGDTYFGELTAYPAGGLSHWPRELDEYLGQFWRLPQDATVLAASAL
jgi:hypothetical protein